MSVLRMKAERGPNCFVLYVLQGSEEPLKLCLYLQCKCSVPPQQLTLKEEDWMSCSGAYCLDPERAEGDPFFSLGRGPPFLNYVVGVPTTSLSSSLSPALSPGWISDLRCSFVSGPLSCSS